MLTAPALASFSKLKLLSALSLVINSDESRPRGYADEHSIIHQDDPHEDDGGGNEWVVGDSGGVGSSEPGEVSQFLADWEAGGAPLGVLPGFIFGGNEDVGLVQPSVGGQGGAGGPRPALSSTLVDAGALAALAPLTHLAELEISLFFKQVGRGKKGTASHFDFRDIFIRWRCLSITIPAELLPLDLQHHLPCVGTKRGSLA